MVVVVVLVEVVVVVGPVVVVVVVLVVVVGAVLVVVATVDVVGGLVVVVVVVVGPAHVPSVSHASNLLKKPSMAPQALPFLHLLAFPTIDDLTTSRLFSEQHTAPFGLPQIDAFSHFMISLRHGFCGMSAVISAALRAVLTHFVYLPCVWPLRVQPQVLWILCRAVSMAAASEHFVLTQAPNTGATVAGNKKAATPATTNQRMLRSPFPRVRRRTPERSARQRFPAAASTIALNPVNTPANRMRGASRSPPVPSSADSPAAALLPRSRCQSGGPPGPPHCNLGGLPNV